MSIVIGLGLIVVGIVALAVKKKEPGLLPVEKQTSLTPVIGLAVILVGVLCLAMGACNSSSEKRADAVPAKDGRSTKSFEEILKPYQSK